MSEDSLEFEKQIENYQSVSWRGRDDQLYGLETVLCPGVYVEEIQGGRPESDGLGQMWWGWVLGGK